MDLTELQLAQALTLVGLVDAAGLYLRLIRRRARARREAHERDEAALRSLVRVMLVDQQAARG